MNLKVWWGEGEFGALKMEEKLIAIFMKRCHITCKGGGGGELEGDIYSRLHARSVNPVSLYSAKFALTPGVSL